MDATAGNKTCPSANKCLTPNIFYEAEISSNTNDEHKKYRGAAETSFKERPSNQFIKEKI